MLPASSSTSVPSFIAAIARPERTIPTCSTHIAEFPQSGSHVQTISSQVHRSPCLWSSHQSAQSPTFLFQTDESHRELRTALRSPLTLSPRSEIFSVKQCCSKILSLRRSGNHPPSF